MTDRTAEATRVAELFLDRVEREATIAHLPADVRISLIERLRGQIDAGVGAAREGEEVTAAFAIIDALGDPRAIVAAARPGPTFTSAGQQFAQSAGPAFASASQQLSQLKDRGAAELAACLLIVLHPLVPGIGFFACVVCLLISERWTPGQKVLGIFGALAFSAATVFGFGAFAMSAGSFGTGAYLGLPALIFGLLVPIGIAFHLWNEAAIPSSDPFATERTVRRVVVTAIAACLILAGLSAFAAIYVGGW